MMRDYIQTNDNGMRDVVGRCNERLTRWEKFIHEQRQDGESYYANRGKVLTLYLDQESAYEHRIVDCGPLQIGYTMAPRENDTTLFGHPVRLIEVLSCGDRYDHLCYV